MTVGEGVTLASIEPWRRSGVDASEARCELLGAAAHNLGLIESFPRDADEWAAVVVPDLAALRAAVEVEGRKGQRKQVAIAGPFADYAGYQWRWSPRHSAATRRQVLSRIDRLITQGVAT